LMPLNEIGHLLTFITLGLLAMGVFRNDWQNSKIAGTNW
jgi:hypothetical protein